jgi:hypothetical protein
LMAREFVTSITEKRAPLSDGRSGLRIVRLLEAAQQSIEQNGRVVKFKETAPRVPLAAALPGLTPPYVPGFQAGALSDRS